MFKLREVGEFTMQLNPDGILCYKPRCLTNPEAETVLRELSETEKSNVKVVDLWSHRLDDVPEALLLFPNMNKLILSGNTIEHIPEWIGNLTALTVINLTDNDLRTIPVSIGNLVNLTRLYLRDNCLKTLPSSMRRLTNLDTLILHNNPLKALPNIYDTKFAYAETQAMLGKIAIAAWTPKARAATLTWVLVGRELGLCKDITRLIARFVYASRIEDVWEF